MNKKFIAFLMVIALAAGAYWYVSSNNSATPNKSGYGQASSTSVTQLIVKSEPVMNQIKLPGRTAAFSQSQVRPQVTGIIKERLFQEGAMVEKGQPLYQLDDARYVANLSSAQANLQSARANFKATQARFKRIQSLLVKKAVSEQDLDDVEAELDQAEAAIAVAKANVELQKINVDYSHVYAPLSGKIGQSKLTVGALVTASQAESLAVITQLDPIYVDMQVSGEQAIGIQKKINQGEVIDVELAAITGGENIRGVLEFSDVNVNETTGSVALRARFDNTDHALLPGLFVSAELSLGIQDAFLVPQRATTRTPKGDLVVWVIDSNNQAHPKTIQVNRALRDQWVVVSGLVDGDRIVMEGYQKLAPGAVVEASPWQAQNTKAEQGG